MFEFKVKAEGNIKATDLELTENFKELVNSGKVFVHSISDAKEGKDGELYFQLYLAQRATLENQNTSELDKLFLGWDSNIRILRNIRNVKLAQAKSNETLQSMCKVGATINANIERYYIDAPEYVDHQPVKALNRETGELEIMFDKETNKPKFERTRLVVGTPNHEYREFYRKSEFTGIGEDVADASLMVSE